MKKLLLLAVLILILSCSTDELTPNNTTITTPPAIDCTCDKVVEVATFNIIGTPQNPAITYYSVYTTINVCTQVQRQKTHSTLFTSEIPKVNQCR